ncbi:MAG: 4'-phosphopantetheinyl transferase superfamily protein [Firmicutes bacterium]|nr:4'-phosphopantetheinyl transferase superfamily protein [Bacillota bacterium]
MREIPKLKIRRYEDFVWEKMTNISIAKDEVHLWIIRWKDMMEKILRYKYILTREERKYANSLRFYDDKMRSLIGRIVLKLLLSNYLKISEEQILLEKERYGKLLIKSTSKSNDIKFNLSHSGEHVSLVFVYQQKVGIDIEKIRLFSEYREITQRYFHPDEQKIILELKGRKGLETFYRYWTMKEAYVKATGDGLNKDLKSFVIVEDGGMKKKVYDDGNLTNYDIYSYITDRNYIGAVAVER